MINTKDGRLVHSTDESFGKKTISDNMSCKRNMLKERAELDIARKGIHIPVFVESYLVFTTPRGLRIHIDDQYKKEGWCFRTDLVNYIDNYVGPARYIISCNFSHLCNQDVTAEPVEKYTFALYSYIVTSSLVLKKYALFVKF